MRLGVWCGRLRWLGLVEMGTSDLRDAFNAVAAPRYRCDKALLSYKTKDRVQSTILTFFGRDQGGAAFEVSSGPIAGSLDVNTAAAAVAQKLLDSGKVQS